jgi:hypothetical protein
MSPDDNNEKLERKKRMNLHQVGQVCVGLDEENLTGLGQCIECSPLLIQL